MTLFHVRGGIENDVYDIKLSVMSDYLNVETLQSITMDSDTIDTKM